MPIELFLTVLERLLEFLIPAAVACCAARRLWLSTGFNRVYYAYALAYAVVGLALLIQKVAPGTMAGLAVRALALSALPLWIFIVHEVRASGGDAPYRLRRREPSPVPPRQGVLVLRGPVATAPPVFRSSRAS